MPIERIPPVRARFPCPQCGEPMDFPSREQAVIQARVRADAERRAAAEAELAKASAPPEAEKRYRVDKRGWEDDSFDRQQIKNLIRTGEILETDRVFDLEGEWKTAVGVKGLKALFDLKRQSTRTPPRCCRTHTDRLAHFFCRDTGRGLCEECASEREFGGNRVRVCVHCGGQVDDEATPPV